MSSQRPVSLRELSEELEWPPLPPPPPGPHIYEDADFCYSHSRIERVESPFLICGECFHRFPTAEDLVHDYNYEMSDLEGFVPKEVDQIFHCPHCVHDF